MLEAKLYFSRRDSSFRDNIELSSKYDMKMRSIASINPRNFAPIVTYIDQIGKFVDEGQTFIPWQPGGDEYVENFATATSIDAAHNAPVHHRIHDYLPYLNRRILYESQVDQEPTTMLDSDGIPLYLRITNRQFAEDLGLLDETGNVRRIHGIHSPP